MKVETWSSSQIVRSRLCFVDKFIGTLFLDSTYKRYHIFVFLCLIFLNLFIYLFIYGCIGSSLPCTGFSLVAVSGGYSSLRCTGFSLRWLLLLRSTDSKLAGFSSCGLRALERRLSSCGSQALLLRGMWDLPGPGLKPMSPALAGGFLTTAPPGKSLSVWFTSLSMMVGGRGKLGDWDWHIHTTIYKIDN